MTTRAAPVHPTAARIQLQAVRPKEDAAQVLQCGMKVALLLLGIPVLD